MRRFVIFDPVTGKIDSCAEVRQPESDDQYMISAGMQKLDIGEFCDPDVSYVLNNAIAPRPACTIYESQMTAPATLNLADGETVFATSEHGASVETSNPSDPIVITSPGLIQVKVTAAFPKRGTVQTIEVI